jgi:hypothetical protein
MLHGLQLGAESVSDTRWQMLPLSQAEDGHAAGATKIVARLRRPSAGSARTNFNQEDCVGPVLHDCQAHDIAW